MGWLLLGLGSLVVLLFALNWFIAWRHNKTDMSRGPETWQGWDSGQGGGGGDGGL